MDKSRQQFEEEFRKNNNLDTDMPFIMWDEIDDYYYLETRQAWQWWKASRESLEIELPDASEYDSGCPNYHDGYNTAMSRAYDELISNGVKIKNES